LPDLRTPTACGIGVLRDRHECLVRARPGEAPSQRPTSSAVAPFDGFPVLAAAAAAARRGHTPARRTGTESQAPRFLNLQLDKPLLGIGLQCRRNLLRKNVHVGGQAMRLNRTARYRGTNEYE